MRLDFVAQDADFDGHQLAVVHGADLDFGQIAVTFNFLVLVINHALFLLLVTINVNPLVRAARWVGSAVFPTTRR